MRTLLRFGLIFLILTGVMAILVQFFPVTLGGGDYWDKHGILLLIGLVFFPRLTLIFSSIPWGGLFWWAGLIFTPRILVAVLATLNYWYMNPLLVACAWLVALGGESSEKYMIYHSPRMGARGARREKEVESTVIR